MGMWRICVSGRAQRTRHHADVRGKASSPGSFRHSPGWSAIPRRRIRSAPGGFAIFLIRYCAEQAILSDIALTFGLAAGGVIVSGSAPIEAPACALRGFLDDGRYRGGRDAPLQGASPRRGASLPWRPACAARGPGPDPTAMGRWTGWRKPAPHVQAPDGARCLSMDRRLGITPAPGTAGQADPGPSMSRMHRIGGIGCP